MNKNFDSKNLIATAQPSDYKRLANGERQAFETRAERFSAATVYTLFPRIGTDGSSKIRAPMSSFPAACVNNLAAKMIETLFPYDQPYLKLDIDAEADAALKSDMDRKSKVKSILSEISFKLCKEVDARNRRPVLQEAFKHLIVVGNVCLFIDSKTGRARNYSLRDYVVERDNYGKLTLLIVRDYVRTSEIRKDFLVACDADKFNTMSDEKLREMYVEVFTRCELNDAGDFYIVSRIINNKKVPVDDSFIPVDALPYIPLRFNATSNSNYGSSYVQDYFSDITAVQGISVAVDRSIQQDAKVIHMVVPGSTASRNLRQLAMADSGSFVLGEAGDINTIQNNKQASNSVAIQWLKEYESKLAKAFLMNSSVQRNGERVTATEINYVARELEQQLGAMYALLSSELQVAMFTVDRKRMIKNNEIPDDDALANRMGLRKLSQIVPITGTAVLSRNTEAAKLREFVSVLAEVGMLEGAISRARLVRELADAMGITSASTIVLTEEELAAEVQRQQDMQLAQSLGPDVVKGEYSLAQQQAQQASQTNGG